MLKRILSEKKDVIVKQWRRRIVGTYPADSSHFLSDKMDQFANPIGAAIRNETEVLFDALIDNKPDAIAPSLDKIIRIRAVQEFTPAQAVSFVYMLKDVIREELSEELSQIEMAHALSEFEPNIDRMALIGFDLYSMCRDQMASIKVNEAHRRTARLVDMLNARGKTKTTEPDNNENENK